MSASLCLGQVQDVREAHSCVLENPRGKEEGWVFCASLPLPSNVHGGSDCSRPYYLFLGSPRSVLTPGLGFILNLIQLNCFSPLAPLALEASGFSPQTLNQA